MCVKFGVVTIRHAILFILKALPRFQGFQGFIELLAPEG